MGETDEKPPEASPEVPPEESPEVSPEEILKKKLDTCISQSNFYLDEENKYIVTLKYIGLLIKRIHQKINENPTSNSLNILSLDNILPNLIAIVDTLKYKLDRFNKFMGKGQQRQQLPTQISNNESKSVEPKTPVPWYNSFTSMFKTKKVQDLK